MKFTQMFISASCSNLKPPQLVAPESRHRKMARANSPCSSRKPMVKQRWNHGNCPFFQQKPAFFGEKDEIPSKRSHVPYFFILESIFKIFNIPWWKHSKNPGVAKLMSLSELTSLLWISLTALILSRWTQSLCVNPGTKTQKYRWWWFQCQRFPNIVGLYLFTSPAKSIWIPKSSDGDPKTRQSVGWGVWACLKCEPIATWSSGGSTNLGIIHIQLPFLTSKSSQFWMIPKCFFPQQKLNEPWPSFSLWGHPVSYRIHANKSWIFTAPFPPSARAAWPNAKRSDRPSSVQLSITPRSRGWDGNLSKWPLARSNGIHFQQVLGQTFSSQSWQSRRGTSVRNRPGSWGSNWRFGKVKHIPVQ